MGKNRKKTETVIDAGLVAEVNAILDELDEEETVVTKADEPGTIAHRSKRIIRTWPKGIKNLGARTVTAVKDNPKTPGSKSYTRFELYRGATTVAEALKAGTYKEDIRWDYERGFIELGD